MLVNSLFPSGLIAESSNDGLHVYDIIEEKSAGKKFNQSTTTIKVILEINHLH